MRSGHITNVILLRTDDPPILAARAALTAVPSASCADAAVVLATVALARKLVRVEAAAAAIEVLKACMRALATASGETGGVVELTIVKSALYTARQAL